MYRFILYLPSLCLSPASPTHSLSYSNSPKGDDNLSLNVQVLWINMKPYDEQHMLFFIICLFSQLHWVSLCQQLWGFCSGKMRGVDSPPGVQNFLEKAWHRKIIINHLIKANEWTATISNHFLWLLGQVFLSTMTLEQIWQIMSLLWWCKVFINDDR